jgi:hypothetical protein
LAVNAFRLPCCEQAICENCQSTLPASCPVCEHSPLSADDCKPHKALRTTIKVFLRTEEKKRESNRPKDTAPTPITPVGPSPISATAPAIPEQVSAVEGTEAVEEQQGPATEQVADAEAPAEQQEGKEVGPEAEGRHGLTDRTADDAVGDICPNPARHRILTRTGNRRCIMKQMANRKPLPRPTWSQSNTIQSLLKATIPQKQRRASRMATTTTRTPRALEQSKPMA